MRLLFGIFVFSTLFHLAESQTVLISEDINVRSDDIYQLIGQADDYILFFHEHSNSTNILAFDENLKYIRTHTMELEKRNAIPFGINIIDNNINYLYYYKERGDIYMMLRKFNSQLELISKDTLFVDTRNDYLPRYELIESEEKSKILIYSIERNKTIIANCFDLENNVNLFHTAIETEGNLRQDLTSTLLSNDGSAYFIVDQSPLSYKKQKVNAQLIRFSPGFDHPLLINVEMTDLNSEFEHFALDNRNDYIVMAGLYSEKSSNRLNGVYVLRLNSVNPEKRVFNKFPFDEQLEAKIIADSRDKHEGVLDLKPVEIILREDGGILFLSEVQRTYQRYGGVTADRGRSSRSWTDYYNEDVVMHAVFPDGSLHWNLVLHKKQYSQDDMAAYSSFFLFKNRSAIRLFYNDEISSNNTVSEYIITGTGKAQRKSVMNTEYQKLKLRFREAIQLDGRSFVVPSDNGNRMNLVKVTYDT